MTHDTTYNAYKVTATSPELPVELALVRQHLRNEDLLWDDDLVKAFIRSASAAVERQYGLALLEQTVVQYHSRFPLQSDTPMLLRIAPLISVTSVVYVDSAGVAQTYSADDYATGHYNLQPFLIPKFGKTWPVAADRPNAVAITYKAGYGTSASAVPHDIRSALLLQIGHLYENREDPPMNLVRASDHLLQPYYRFSG